MRMESILKNQSEIINQTQCWLESIIIGLNFCPFAKKEFINDTIRYSLCETTDIEASLELFATELQYLDSHPDTETSLFIFADNTLDFDHFLDLIDYANQLLQDLGYQSVYQLAHFHPLYCFDGEQADDASNYTNRSPYPTLHIIREQSLQQAIKNHPDTSQIPDTNIQLARKLGAAHLQEMLDRCVQK